MLLRGFRAVATVARVVGTRRLSLSPNTVERRERPPLEPARCSEQNRRKPVTQVVVYPDTLTLDPFQSFQFRVFGRTEAGDSVPVSVRWVASAGAISQFGMYSADTSAADAVLTATLTNSTVRGSSRVKKRR